MSITSDIRGYTDTALDQGRQFVEQAQAQLTDVAGSVLSPANDFVGKLADTAKSNAADVRGKAAATADDLRKQAEKAINFDAVKSAVEPYLAQAKDYRAAVTDRAEALYATVTSDSRVNRAIGGVEALSGLVIETVQQRVVTPVLTLAGRKPTATARPTASAPKAPAAKVSAPKATTRKPAAKSTTRKPATKKTATKRAAKPATKASPSA